MNGPTHIDSDLLARYLAGEASAEERTSVEQWAASHPANAEELERMRSVWSFTGEGELHDVDVDAAWNKVAARMDAGPKGRVVPFFPRSRVVGWVAAAAVVVGLCFALLLKFQKEGYDLNSDGTYLTATLHDSSEVVLSPRSALTATFAEQRHVALKGEAYFEVQRDVQHPFVVEAGEVMVTVLGTGFEVSAYDTARVVTIRVRHGRVRVATDRDSLELVTGEQAAFDRYTHRLVRMEVPSSVVWGDRIIQFDHSTLSAVADRLQTLFKVKVELRNADLANCKLTATFDNESVDGILKVVADTFGLTLGKPSSDHFTLDGEGC